ncbi:MAG: hypothetical protein LBB65_04825 [Burkholderiales bacterium]|jgi:hypothetical protein|nr:hypothetical protein [Burkholderiales bacterium]
MSENEMNEAGDTLERAKALQEEGARLFEQRQEEDALRLYRAAGSLFRISMESTVSPETAHRYALLLQGLAVAAAVTGRIDEARFAVGTGLVNISVARKTWPDIDEFAELQQTFASLEEKLGGNCPIYLSDEPENWLSDD